MVSRATQRKGLQHPWRVVAPLILWGTSLGFDAMSRLTEDPRLGRVALLPLVLGVCVGVSVAALELHGVLRLPHASPSLRAAFWLLIADVAALGMFTASALVRWVGLERGLALDLSMLGFFGAMLAGFTRDLLGVRTAPVRPGAPRVPAEECPRWPATFEELPPES